MNLIEPTDEFSPDPLNENMEALETLLGGWEVHTGTYTGDGKDKREITVGVRPKLVILLGKWNNGHAVHFLTEWMQFGLTDSGVSPSTDITITDTGFRCENKYCHNQAQLDEKWIALG